MLFINSKCSTQPTPGCVTWRRQRPETARSAHHTPATHGAPTNLYPHGRYRTAPRTPRSPPTALDYPWYSRPAVIHDCARLEPARNREPTPQQAHSEKAGPPCVAELRSTHMLNRPVRGDIPERWVCGHENAEEGPCSTNSTSTCILGYQAEREVSASAKRQV